MKQLIKIVKQISILVLAISLFGCNNEDTDYPEVVAGFTYTVNPATGTVVFINISEKASTYEWKFGDGETSTEINPVKSYAAGTYTIILKAKNEAGGSDTFESKITIITPVTPCTSDVAESLSAASLNMTFKTEPVTGSIIADGASFAWVSNPSFDNIVNKSCKVGKITKLGNNPWDNNQIVLDGKLDFNANAGLKIKVYSAKAGFKVRIKLEDKTNAGTNTELEITTTKTNAWEELTFDFATTQTNKFDKIVIFFDLNANNKDTYYFDDLKLYTRVGGGGGGTCTAETAETLGATGLNMTFKSDLSSSIISDGAGFSWADNPNSANTVNSSCKVGKVVKSGQFPWDNNQVNLNAKLDFTANAGLKIKVYSAKAGFKVRIKLEEIGNAGNNTELEVPTTKTNAWEELTFPFAATNTNKFNKIVIFFDLDGNNKDTYYFDDLKVYDRTTGGGGGTGTAGGLAQNSDFETGALSGWIAFQNGGTAVLDNTTSSGAGTWSGKLVTNGPSNPAFKQERVGAGAVKAGDVITVKFDLKGSVVQPGAVLNFILFGEGAAGASFTKVFSPAPTLTSAWTTYTGTYTILAGTDVSGGLSFLIEAVCGGDAGCKVTANIDNVSVKVN